MPCGIICDRITPARGNLEHRPLSGAVLRYIRFTFDLDFRFLLTKMNEDQREEIMALEAILPPDEFYFDADNMEGELRISPRLDSEISVRIQGRSVSSSCGKNDIQFL